jgi:hypothetical protein
MPDQPGDHALVRRGPKAVSSHANVKYQHGGEAEPPVWQPIASLAVSHRQGFGDGKDSPAGRTKRMTPRNKHVVRH